MGEAATRRLILAEARSWLGTPYHHQGFVKGAGVDCAFFLSKVYHAAGLIPDIDPRPYPPDWFFHQDAERYMGWVQRYAHPVSAPKPGDVALYKFGRCASHGAIVIEWPTIIHAVLNEGCVIGDGTQGHFKNRLAIDPKKGLTGFWSLQSWGDK